MESQINSSLQWLPTTVAALVAVLCFGLLAHGLRKMRSTDTITAMGWWAAGAVTAGSGLCAAQYFALSGLMLPWDLAFRPASVGLAWMVAVLGSFLILATAKLSLDDEARVLVQAPLLAVLWLAVLALAQRSLSVPPQFSVFSVNGPVAGLGLVLASAMLALWVTFGPRWAKTGAFGSRQWLGAAVFGLFTGLAQHMSLNELRFPTDVPPDLAATLDTVTVQLLAAPWP